MASKHAVQAQCGRQSAEAESIQEGAGPHELCQAFPFGTSRQVLMFCVSAMGLIGATSIAGAVRPGFGCAWVSLTGKADRAALSRLLGDLERTAAAVRQQGVVQTRRRSSGLGVAQGTDHRKPPRSVPAGATAPSSQGRAAGATAPGMVYQR